jgi:hypothetical protein
MKPCPPYIIAPKRKRSLIIKGGYLKFNSLWSDVIFHKYAEALAQNKLNDNTTRINTFFIVRSTIDDTSRAQFERTNFLGCVHCPALHSALDHDDLPCNMSRDGRGGEDSNLIRYVARCGYLFQWSTVHAL